MTQTTKRRHLLRRPLVTFNPQFKVTPRKRIADQTTRLLPYCYCLVCHWLHDHV